MAPKLQIKGGFTLDLFTTLRSATPDLEDFSSDSEPEDCGVCL